MAARVIDIIANPASPASSRPYGSVKRGVALSVSSARLAAIQHAVNPTGVIPACDAVSLKVSSTISGGV